MPIWVVWFIYDFKLAFLLDVEWLLSRLRTAKRIINKTHGISINHNGKIAGIGKNLRYSVSVKTVGV